MQQHVQYQDADAPDIRSLTLALHARPAATIQASIQAEMKKDLGWE